ncbi:MAG: HDIG domain-containing metalloprotein [Acidobacteriota bacterium]
MTSKPPSASATTTTRASGARTQRVGTGRGQRPSGLRRWTSRARDGWAALLEMPAVWVVLTLALGTLVLLPEGLFFNPRIAAGSLAGRDYVAPQDLEILDSQATEEKRLRAQEEVLPVYDFDPRLRGEVDAQFGRLFAEGRIEGVEPPSREILAEASGLEVGPAQRRLLIDEGFSEDLEDRVRSLLGEVHRRKVVNNRARLLGNTARGVTVRNLESSLEVTERNLFETLGSGDELRDFLAAEVRNWPGLTASQRRDLGELLADNLSSNLASNRVETESRQRAAREQVEPLFTRVRKGQVIVRKGDAVDESQAAAIASFSGRRSLGEKLLPVFGTVFLLTLAALVLWLGMGRERVASHSRSRAFGEVLLTLLLSLLGAKLAFVVAAALGSSIERAPFDSIESYVFAVPFAAAALIAGLLFGRPVALLSSLVFSILVSRLAVGEPLAVVIFSLAGSLAAVFGLEQVQIKQRLIMVRIGLLVGVVNVGAVLLLRALSDSPLGAADLAFRLLCAFAGGLLVTAVASFAIPILESLLGITTDIKLIELSNTNLPLLRRLAFEAPGSFQHSLMVANLAKVGCEAVGADANLAYAAGLYHDVGKVFRPEYFVENQRPGHNRHDKLAPSMSALILINHVKEGVELAREHHLPQVIIDAIEQHHGTRLIKFFFNRALERCDPTTGSVREEKYRYPGPKPQDKVMGVLMLADAVEAASRTLVDPSPAKVRGLIRTLIEDVLSDGQLDCTDLTLADLRQVAEAFQRVLTNIFHRRIDYPGFDFNAPPKRERKAAEVRAS